MTTSLTCAFDKGEIDQDELCIDLTKATRKAISRELLWACDCLNTTTGHRTELKLGYLKDSNAAAHSVDTGIS